MQDSENDRRIVDGKTSAKFCVVNSNGTTPDPNICRLMALNIRGNIENLCSSGMCSSVCLASDASYDDADLPLREGS